MIKRLLLCMAMLCAFSVSLYAKSSDKLRSDALSKMKQLEKLIDKAESKQINTLKERTALRTAEIWMIYADWDEQNVDKTQEHYELYEPYREKAREYAEMMPSFQRNAIVEMMDSSISALKSVLAGKSYRLDTPEVDWAEVYVEDDQLYMRASQSSWQTGHGSQSSQSMRSISVSWLVSISPPQVCSILRVM